MIGATPLTAIFGSRGTPIRTVAEAKAYARQLCDAGMAVMIMHPGTKEPADLRTPQKRAADDRAARTAAQEAGRPDWERVRAPSGLYLATNDKTVICRYIDRFYTIHQPACDGIADHETGEVCIHRQSNEPCPTGIPINFAVEVGRSNLLVVDADTEEQVNEFLRMCGIPEDQPMPPTVRSPGQMRGGEWVHRNGGHFYFTVDPEHPLPTEIGSTNIGVSGIAVLWHNRYVLIPPSVRPEGQYELAGRDYPAPSQLVELIVDRNRARTERAAARRNQFQDDELGSRIDDWAQANSWEEILAPYGWVPVSSPDNCGCPMFTAPGDHSSPKSATAHDNGCSLGWWDNNTNAPLHIWTDNPGEPFESWVQESGLKTLTKFQVVALLEYDGDQALAMDALGIAPDMGVDIEGINVGGIATEDADPRNLNDDTAANLTQNPESCEHARLHGDGTCVACGEQISPPMSNVQVQEIVETTYQDTPPDPDPTWDGGSDAPQGPVTQADVPRDELIDAQEAAPEEPPRVAAEMSLRELAGAPPPQVGEDGFPIIGQIDEGSGLYMPHNAGVPEMAPFRHWRDLPPPEYVVEGLLENGGLTCIIGSPGAGKALSLDTLLPTPTGWTTMGEIKVGDLLLGRDGLPTAVRAATGVMYGRPCYEVEFSDGSVLIADAQHQWLTQTLRDRAFNSKNRGREGKHRSGDVRTTEEIATTLRVGVRGLLNHSVENTAPLDLPDRDLPVTPYTLGAWLGDGDSRGASITSVDPEILMRIESDGYAVTPIAGRYRYSIQLPDGDRFLTVRECVVCGKEFQPRRWHIKTCGQSCGGKARFLTQKASTCSVCGESYSGYGGICKTCHLCQRSLRARLSALRVLRNKHIPTEYLRASEHQRRELLAGLLDTDGTVGSGGEAIFCNTDRRLAQDVFELIISLGYRARMYEADAPHTRKGTSILVKFSTPDQVFRLPRKALLMKERRASTSDARSRTRTIVAVRAVESVPVRCVEVSNAEHMFLAGLSMVPTKNSTLGLDIACHVALGRRWQGRNVLKQKVLYLPGEGLSGVVSRLNAWEESHDASVGEDMIIGNGIIQLGATREAWAEIREYIARQGIGLIIFDTFARMATNIDENSATDVGKAIKRFDQIRELTHCGVLVVHHTGKASPDVARGSSALNGALDSELLVRTENARVEIPPVEGRAAGWGKAIHLRVTKQKNAEQLDEEIDLLMVNWHDRAPIITGPTGTIDPMQGEVLLARPVPEPLIETAVRIRAFVERFTEQGCTRADIAAGVVPDAYTQGLRYMERQWKLKVAEAVDRSLRWGLLQTIEGMSTRYERGPVDPTDARQIAAEEVMVPDVPRDQ